MVTVPVWSKLTRLAAVGVAARRSALGMAVRLTPAGVGATKPGSGLLKFAVPTYTPLASTPRVGKPSSRLAGPV